MKKRNYLLLALLATMPLSVVSAMTACGDNADSVIPTTDTASVQAETTEEVSDQPKLSVPKTDYDGYTVHYLTGTDYTGRFCLISEEETGDTLNDAAYRRNLAVSEHLNVQFTSTEVDLNAMAKTLNTSVMAGGGEYDFVLPHPTIGVTAMVTGATLMDWNQLEGIDFDQPWWNGNMVTSLSIDGKVFYACCDLVMTWQGMGAYLFNKDYLADYDLGTDMYEYVYDGTWTVDKLLSLSKNMYRDLDGDGVATKEDQYGLLANLGGTYWYQFGCEQPYTKIGDDGCPVLDMGTERMTRVVEKYYELLYAPDTYKDSFSSSSYPTSDYRNMLISGRSFLTFFDIGGLHTYLREIEFEFGILPMPKLDETQKDYHSFCGAGLIGIPAASPALERSADIAETLAYYSYTVLRPDFFDVVLQNKALRDEDSFNMLTLMHESKVFDFGFNFNETAFSALDSVVVTKKSTDFASYYAKIEDKVNKELRDIFDAVEENALAE